MKIIYITNNRIPTEKAHGFQVMKMCEAFAKYRSGSTQIAADQREIEYPHKSAQDQRESASINVELWVPKRFNPIKEPPFDYYGIREIFTIKKIPVIDFIPLYRFFGVFANFFESISFAFFVLFNLYRSGSTQIEADQRGNFPHESAINPHKSASNEIIIYSRDQFILWFLSFTNKKFVYEVHSFPSKPVFYKRIWKRAYKIVTITAALKAKIVKTGINESKIIIAHDAVDLAAFNTVSTAKEELKIELGLSKNDFLVGYIGKFKTLGMEKGIATMIEALPLLDKEIKMVFVGGDELEIKEYKSFANRFNVLPQCSFFGYQSYLQLIRYNKAMDVLVIPFPNKPHYAYYASPLKLFEYMASGRPIIASDLPTLREVLNNKNALFFKPEDTTDLARAIKMLKSSQMLGYHLSQQALADVKEYTWDKRAQNILNFIK